MRIKATPVATAKQERKALRSYGAYRKGEARKARRNAKLTLKRIHGTEG